MTNLPPELLSKLQDSATDTLQWAMLAADMIKELRHQGLIGPLSQDPGHCRLCGLQLAVARFREIGTEAQQLDGDIRWNDAVGDVEKLLGVLLHDAS